MCLCMREKNNVRGSRRKKAPDSHYTKLENIKEIQKEYRRKSGGEKRERKTPSWRYGRNVWVEMGKGEAEKVVGKEAYLFPPFPPPPLDLVHPSHSRSIHSCISGTHLPSSSTRAASPWQPLTISSLCLSSFATAVALPPSLFHRSSAKEKGGREKIGPLPPCQAELQGEGARYRKLPRMDGGGGVSGSTAHPPSSSATRGGDMGIGGEGGLLLPLPSSFPQAFPPPSLALLQFSFRLPFFLSPFSLYGSPAAWQPPLSTVPFYLQFPSPHHQYLPAPNRSSTPSTASHPHRIPSPMENLQMLICIWKYEARDAALSPSLTD